MEQEREKNWIERNWKWCVPVGCFGSVLVIVAFGALIALLVFSMIKSSDVYKEALAKAQASEAVQEVMGVPIEGDWYVMGSVRLNGSSGNADLSIPIEGPKGEGTVYLVAQKAAGEWEFSSLVVRFEKENGKVNLLE